MYFLEEFVTEAGEFKMTPPMKTAAVVGGVALAAGLAFAFWPKAASAAAPAAPAPAAPALGQQWAQASSLVPGTVYTVIATAPTAGGATMIDRTSAAAALSAAGWSNGQIVYYPGDASTPQLPGFAPFVNLPGTVYIFQGTYNGPQAPIPPGMTAYALVSG